MKYHTATFFYKI